MSFLYKELISIKRFIFSLNLTEVCGHITEECFFKNISIRLARFGFYMAGAEEEQGDVRNSKGISFAMPDRGLVISNFSKSGTDTRASDKMLMGGARLNSLLTGSKDSEVFSFLKVCEKSYIDFIGEDKNPSVFECLDLLIIGMYENVKNIKGLSFYSFCFLLSSLFDGALPVSWECRCMIYRLNSGSYVDFILSKFFELCIFKFSVFNFVCIRLSMVYYRISDSIKRVFHYLYGKNIKTKLIYCVCVYVKDSDLFLENKDFMPSEDTCNVFVLFSECVNGIKYHVLCVDIIFRNYRKRDKSGISFSLNWYLIFDYDLIRYGFYCFRKSVRCLVDPHSGTKRKVNDLFTFINRYYKGFVDLVPIKAVELLGLHVDDYVVLINSEFSFNYIVCFYLRKCRFEFIRFKSFIHLFGSLFIYGMEIYQRCVFIDTLRFICILRYYLFHLYDCHDLASIVLRYGDVVDTSVELSRDKIIDFCLSLFISFYSNSLFYPLFIMFNFKVGGIKSYVTSTFHDVCFQFFNTCFYSSDSI